MIRLLDFFLVLVAVLQVCWLGETWQWTVATMVVGVIAVEALRAKLDDGKQGEGADPSDEGQGAEQPGQQVGDQRLGIDTGGAVQ